MPVRLQNLLINLLTFKQFAFGVAFYSAMICVSFNLSAQTNQSDRVVDSMLRLASTRPHDTLKLETMAVLTDLLCEMDVPRALSFGHQTINLAKQIKWKRGFGLAIQTLSKAHNVAGNRDSAIYYGNISIEIDKITGTQSDIARSYNSQAVNYLNIGNTKTAVKLLYKAKYHNSLSNDTSGLGDIYLNLAFAASLDGDMNKTLEYDIKALSAYEKINDLNMLGVAYNNIAIDYDHLGDYKEAASFAKKSIKLSKKRGDIASETEAHLNLGTIYYHMNKIQESYLEIQESIRLIALIGSNVRLIEAYSNMAELLNHQKRYTEAEEYLKKSLSIAREVEDEYSILFGLSVLGDNALLQNKYDQAITYYQESNKFAERDSSLETLEKNYQGLAKAHAAMNNYLKAYEFEKKLKDLIVTKGGKEKSEQLSRMRTEFETERKQHQIEVLSKDTLIQQKEINRQKLIRNAVIAGLSVVFLFLIVVIFQKRRIAIEKARSEELLLNILPYETAQELKEKGSANAKLFEEVTVLFTDFKGFTQVAEQLSPQELVAEIHYCFKAFDLIMERYRIEKIKTIGDAYMAAAGLPVENKSNPEAVVSAALEIQQFINQYSIERKQAGKHAFEIRIGIHTGPVVAGIVGIKKFQYDIWGDTVNIASRMESSGEAGQINISQSTYTHVKDHFNCVHRGKIEAKNKGQIDMYFVLAKLPVAGIPKSV